MPLKVVLRPDEKIIINGAVVGAGDRPGVLYLYNTVNFLRGREILKEELIDCVEKKLYFIIQLIYIFPEDTALNLTRFESILAEARETRADAAKSLDEIAQLVGEGNYYRALKICRKLFKPDTGKARAPSAAGAES
ncbi:flagellar biosynthesis repressor FlbT [Azospirillum sp.]|uniref:flagellar biosynthesis repressor FlbT n=1 Tax=Azospirillum sp. TaxID=34012 RepID=UPI002D54B230|nr:flagellar biosynthesis repressor FlbT [Azospirillum sp.]HYD69891.1 flagellar biosynthesis repressor FlbT [Azospirillum sp.]